MGPVIIASPDGGMDIEEVAEKTPEKVLKLPIDPFGGVTMKQALEVADFLHFKGELRCLLIYDYLKYIFHRFFNILDKKLLTKYWNSTNSSRKWMPFKLK